MKAEIRALGIILPLCSQVLTAEWYPRALLTDASETGGAVCVAESSQEELRALEVEVVESALIARLLAWQLEGLFPGVRHERVF